MCQPDAPCAVLYVEDDQSIIEVVQTQQAELLNAGIRFLFAASIPEARKILKENDVVIILLDLNIHGSSGVATLKSIVQLTGERRIPIYVYTGIYNEIERRDLLASGAREVFFKSDISLLNTIVFAHHAANEERKTQRLRIERDFFKYNAENLRIQCDELTEELRQIKG